MQVVSHAIYTRQYLTGIKRGTLVDEQRCHAVVSANQSTETAAS